MNSELINVMGRKTKLLRSMTVAQFENGYWYATELKNFADEIGIPSASKLRKDELEKAIVTFLQTGKTKLPTARALSRKGVRDIDQGLSLRLPVVNYTSNRETKKFLETEALKIAPNLKRKSGARYRLNRWREEQLTKNIRINYGDLVRRYVELNQTVGRFAKVPIRCYVNFLSDFLSLEKNATRDKAIKAWKELKEMDVPKDYRSWNKAKTTKK